MKRLRRPRRPYDLDWNEYYDTPEVMQSLFEKPTKRISYNPDDDRFYVEKVNEYGDFETFHTFANNIKGWHNAKYCYWYRVRA